MNYELIGGEMADFSEDREPVGGALPAYLIGLLRPLGGRVLVAGPHSPALIDALADFAEVTCLVRSQPDAAALSDRGVTVLCGSLAKLTGAEQYDAVVALDGVERLCSAEGPQYDWSESVRVLHRVLRPGGALLLAVENELGVHRLVDRATVTFAHTTDAWCPLGEFGTKPGSPERLESRLAAEGLTVGWLGAAWPLPAAPEFAATPAALREGSSGALSAAAAASVASAFAGRPVLSDPRRLTATAIRAGVGAEFAPAWLVCAFRGTDPGLIVPPVLTGGGPAGVLPAGRVLEELLIGACLRHDLPAIRRLLAGWVERAPAAGFDNVLVDGDAYTVLDPARATGEPGAALRRFAHTLLAGGYAQPWPAAADVPSLTTILLAAAGVADAATGAAGARATPAAPDSMREHEEQVRRLEEQLADAAARVAYVETELIRRDAELRRARLQIDAFSGKVGYRITRLGARAARKAVRAVRRSPLFKD